MKTLINIIVILFTLSLSAQNASFVWSDISNNTNEGLINPKLVFPTNDGFTVYSSEKLGTQVFAPDIIYISKFNAQGDKLSTQELTLPQRQRKDATLLNIIEGEDKLYIFSYIALKKDKKNILYAQVYDNSTNEISPIKEVYTLPIEKVNNSGFFEVEISDDKNKIAVLVNDVFVKKTKEKIKALILNENLETLTNVSHTLSFDSKRAYDEKLAVTNDGTIIITKKTGNFKKEPKTSLIVINDQNVTKQTVSSEKFYILDSKVIEAKGNFYLVGFATDNAKPAVSVGGVKAKSFFLHDISNSSLVVNQGWTKAVLKRVLGKGFTNFKVKDVLIDDNLIYLVGDGFSKKSEPIPGENFKYDYEYNFGPGVAIKLNLNGEVLYQSFIKYGDNYKNRASILGSFFSYLDNGQLKVLMNEKTSILKNKKIVAGRAVYEETIVLRTFDNQGVINTMPFWNSKTGGKNDLVYFAPTITQNLDANNFYIYAFGGEYQRFGKMIIE